MRIEVVADVDAAALHFEERARAHDAVPARDDDRVAAVLVLNRLDRVLDVGRLRQHEVFVAVLNFAGVVCPELERHLPERLVVVVLGRGGRVDADVEVRLFVSSSMPMAQTRSFLIGPPNENVASRW
jgi:hypothetical protein